MPDAKRNKIMLGCTNLHVSLTSVILLVISLTKLTNSTHYLRFNAVFHVNVGWLVTTVSLFFTCSGREFLGTIGTGIFTGRMPFLLPNKQCQITKQNLQNMMAVDCIRHMGHSKYSVNTAMTGCTDTEQVENIPMVSINFGNLRNITAPYGPCPVQLLRVCSL